MVNHVQTEDHPIDPAPPRLLGEVVDDFNSRMHSLLGSPLGEDAYEVVEAQMDCVRLVVQELRNSGEIHDDNAMALQAWFRKRTASYFEMSPLISRARNWPEGYPGDFRTLESIYTKTSHGTGLGRLLDNYLLSRTLAVAIRSRKREMSRQLKEVSHLGGLWLNLACGSCRELQPILEESRDRSIVCMDADQNALEFADQLLSAGQNTRFVKENVLRLVDHDRVVNRFGRPAVIYSAGLFDYLPDRSLVRLLNSLYKSLGIGGRLIAPFKDRIRYEVFDYHWGACWNQFFQRDRSAFESVFEQAGIPRESIRVTRDETGVILFFTVTKD